MSAERYQGNHEQRERPNEELETARREQLEKLQNQPETNPDNPEDRAEAAREVINKSEQAPEPPPAPEAAPKSKPMQFLDHTLNYTQTLASMQRKLSPVSRQFSKVIHNPAVEKTSEVLEKTIARPSVTVGATWTALIIGSVFYFTARQYGYALHGSEMLFSFIAGALLGLLLEAVWRRLKYHRSNQ